MSDGQIIIQLINSGFSSIYWILGMFGALFFTLITGSFLYTFYSNRSLWDEISIIKDNELKHIEERLKNIESK